MTDIDSVKENPIETRPPAQNTDLPKKKSRLLREPTAAFMKWAELLKTVVEIVAVIVGAWWAYSRFFAAEAPSLEENGIIESSLDWTPVDLQRCTAVLGITIKNVGKRSFNVRNATVAVWLVPQPPAGAGIVRIKPYELIKGDPTFLDDITQKSLTGHYAPNATQHDDFVFSIPRDAKGKAQTALFTFEADAVTTDQKPLKVPLGDYRWSANCEVPLKQ